MEIHFEIGDRCMLKCRHCSSLATEFGNIMGYSEEHMIYLLKSLSGPKRVFLTGGEPLLYDGLEQLLKRLQCEIEDIEIGLFTTGIIAKNSENVEAISEDYACILAKSGLKECYLSVYSHLEREHDWMTKSKGSFSMLKKSMIHLKKAGIEIKFNCVVTKKNKDSIEKIIEYAEKMGATEVRLLKLIRQGRAVNCWDKLGITDEQYRSVINEIMSKKKNIYITASGMVDIFPCRNTYSPNTCPAGSTLLYISKNGDIFPCASVKERGEYKIANITERDVNQKRQFFADRKSDKMLCVNLKK